MLPGYVAELERLRRGETYAATASRLRAGGEVRIVAPGDRFDGVVGVLLKQARSRFHVRVGDRVLTVPFAMVEPV